MYFWDEALFLTLLESLISMPAPTGREEKRRQVLENFFKSSSIPFHVDKLGNLELIIEGREAIAPCVLDAHIDVVGAGGGRLIAEEEYLTGPGVADNLAAVSFLAILIERIYKKKILPERPLHFLFSVAEEGEGNLRGIKHYISRSNFLPYAFLCLDLAMENFALSYVGSRRYRVSIEGPGGHSWEDFGNESAVLTLLSFLKKVSEFADRPDSENKKLLSFNIGKIEGGEGINIIAQKAWASFEFRSMDPLRLDRLDRSLRSMALSFPLKPYIEDTGQRPAALASDSGFLAKAVKKAALSEEMRLREKPISTNANAALAAAWPSLSFGICDCGNIHRSDEFIRRDSLKKGWRFLISILRELSLFKAEDLL